MRNNFTKILLTAVALCVSFSVAAYDFEAEGICYNITSEADKTVEVTIRDIDYEGDIIIPSTVVNSGTTYAVTSIGYGAFSGCSNLASVNVPDGVNSIGEGAFYFCRNLTSVTLGSGLETIGASAFSWCSSLASIDIPDWVTSIGENAFYNCSSLTEIYCAATVPPVCGSHCFDNVEFACTLYVPEGTTDDYKSADEWKYFTNIVETDLSGNANFEAEGIYYTITSEADKTVKVTSGEDKYTGDIIIPLTVEKAGITYSVVAIGERAFCWCYDLKSIVIPDGVTSIGEGAFYGCEGLTTITIPDGVTSISGSTFRHCAGLTSVTIGSGVETIGDYAFYGCEGLTTITIPDGVTSIGESAFEYCSDLAVIYCTATVPPVCGSRCFSQVDTQACILNVPEGTTDDYKAADQWRNFTNIVETDFAGSDEIAADASADVKVYAAAGRIVVENAAAGMPIAVYYADGVLIYSGVVSDTRTEIPAPAGKLYIVKCGKAVFKTVM